MYQQITIQTLHKQGVKTAQIAREIGCHRNTVANVLQREQVIEKQTRVKSSVFALYETYIKEHLDKKVTILRIYEILRKNRYADDSSWLRYGKRYMTIQKARDILGNRAEKLNDEEMYRLIRHLTILVNRVIDQVISRQEES